MEQNMYYGAGLLSNFDKYPENKKTVLNKYPKKKSRVEETTTKQTLYTLPEVLHEIPVIIQSVTKLNLMKKRKIGSCI